MDYNKLGKERLTPMVDENKAQDVDLEWERRVLCSDESCIGTIGPDGRCKECGKLYEGPLAVVSEKIQGDDKAAPIDDQQSEPDGSGTQVVHAVPADAAQSVFSDDEWARRTLCEDESCIGTIGSDGRCKECGKLYGGQG